MWFSLRSGLANTAVIEAIASLPLISVANALLHHEPGQTRIDTVSAQSEQLVWRAAPLPIDCD